MHKSLVEIGLIKPKSPVNVGAVLRAAGCFRAQRIFYTGDRYDRATKFNTDTTNAKSSIPLNNVDDLLATAPETSKKVCIELAEGATPLTEYQHPAHAFYIFGPEDGTISQSIIDNADDVVYIPTIGCMNLAATVSIVLYDRLAKSKEIIVDEELIKRSRDTNNTVRVR